MIPYLTAARRLRDWPSYLSNSQSTAQLGKSLTFFSFTLLLLTCSLILLTFILCHYHSTLTNPLFSQPRRHRLPSLVPPPFPRTHFLSWIPVCIYMSDNEIVAKVGYDALIFLRFHRMATRILLQAAAYSFIVLLPTNYDGAERYNDEFNEVLEYDFSQYSVANIAEGSSTFWLHCIGIYLLSFIMIRELLFEYSKNNDLRHRYLLSREPHRRTVLITNIPRNIRSEAMITTYERERSEWRQVETRGASETRDASRWRSSLANSVAPPPTSLVPLPSTLAHARFVRRHFNDLHHNAVRSSAICQRLTRLEYLVKQRTQALSECERLSLAALHRTQLWAKYRRRSDTLSFFSRCSFICCNSSRVFGYGNTYYAKKLASRYEDVE